MTDKSEAQIMEKWPDTEPKVSIMCMTYNHEHYIAEALDSFLSQETDFSFQVIVHDDASTDATADIIRRYAEKYPHIIRPIYEEENQYLKPDSLTREKVAACLRGEYYAICEGDDHWCDNKKLQKQYDYMSQHDDCVLCCHNSIIHDVSGKEADKLTSHWDDIHTATEGDIFFGWNIQTSSFFCKPAVWEAVGKYRYFFGDYILMTQALSMGNIVIMPNVMSVYNKNMPNGAVQRNTNHGIEKFYKATRGRIEYLRRYDEQTEGKFHEIVQARIASFTYSTDFDEESLRRASHILKKSEYYYVVEADANRSNNKLKRLWLSWKYRGSSFGKLWYWSMLLWRRLNEYRYGHR